MAMKMDSWKTRACALLLAGAGVLAPATFAQVPAPAAQATLRDRNPAREALGGLSQLIDDDEPGLI